MSDVALARLAVCAAHEHYAPVAQQLAEQLALPIVPDGTMPRDCRLAAALLLVDDSHLALQLCGRKAPGAVSVDFGAAGMRYRRLSGHNELLGRAVGVGKKQALSVIDATAGLGRDSFVLADLGAKVRLYERHPVVAALLAAGLASGRATADTWLNTVLARMSLVAGDVRELRHEELVAADVIYLDPMFPQRDKAAAVKKEMALFQFLLQDEPDDAPALLAWALQQPVARVVVKRPAKAAPVAGLEPSHAIRGKAIRYDVHVLSGLG